MWTHLYDMNVGHADQRQNGPKNPWPSKHDEEDQSSDNKQTCCPSGARVLGREAMRDKRLAHSPLSSRSIRELCAACAHGRTAWRICQNLRDRARSREHDKHRKGGHKGATRTSSCNRWQLGSALPKRISSPSGAPHSDLSPARWQECGGFRAVPFGQKTLRDNKQT